MSEWNLGLVDNLENAYCEILGAEFLSMLGFNVPKYRLVFEDDDLAYLYKTTIADKELSPEEAEVFEALKVILPALEDESLVEPMEGAEDMAAHQQFHFTEDVRSGLVNMQRVILETISDIGYGFDEVPEDFKEVYLRRLLVRYHVYVLGYCLSDALEKFFNVMID